MSTKAWNTYRKLVILSFYKWLSCSNSYCYYEGSYGWSNYGIYTDSFRVIETWSREISY